MALFIELLQVGPEVMKIMVVEKKRKGGAMLHTIVNKVISQ